MDRQEVYDMWEDSIGSGIANSASGGGIAGLPPDQPPFFKKKKKKKYDGRHKDVREFVNKLLKKREQRIRRKERKLKERNDAITNSMIEEELLALQESGGKVIDQLKTIAQSGGTGVVRFDDGSKQPVNPAEAGKIVNLYRDLNASNRVKMIKSINSSSSSYEKVKSFAQSRQG